MEMIVLAAIMCQTQLAHMCGPNPVPPTAIIITRTTPSTTFGSAHITQRSHHDAAKPSTANVR